MRSGVILTGIMMLMSPACSHGAGILISVRLPQEISPQVLARLEASKPTLASLLAPGSTEVPGSAGKPLYRYARMSRAGYNPALPADQRRQLLNELRGVWKEALTVEDLPEDRAPDAEYPGNAPAYNRFNPGEISRHITAALDVGPSHESQNLYYDQASGKTAASAVAADRAKPAGKTRATPLEKGLKISALPSPKPVGTKPRVNWGRAGLEALKGVGEVIREVFTLKGLAIAAGAVALVTVAPIAVYGFLALGVVMGGYTVGKAIYDGVKAHRKGDVNGVYAASREFGKGALTLGLSIYGARHVPKTLTPHIPRAGEYKALLSSMDDEAVVVTSLFDHFRSKPAPAL